MGIDPDQCRSARELLRWTREKLAEEAGCSPFTVRNFERDRPVTMGVATDIERAFVRAGVEFIPENGGGAGVRWREPRGGKGK